jgi:hypothetical protein
MASPIEAILLLCDAAVADPTGKIHMLGAGWSMTSSPTPPSAVAVFLKVPWDRSNQKLPCALQLRDADGQPVKIEDQTIGVEQTLEVGRPPGLPPGTPLDAAFSLSAPSLPLAPGRYEWVLTVAEGQWAISFTVRAAA